MFIDGADATSSHPFDVRDPGRVSDVVAIVAGGDAATVDVAVVTAERAQRGWAERSVDERITLLSAALDAVEPQVHWLAELLARENGGTRFESTMDISRGVAMFRDFLDRTPAFLAPQVVDDPTQYFLRERTPVGVAGLIVPWNSPVVLTMSKLAPALALGNTVVLKPSVLAPAALGEVLRILGRHLPAGGLNVVHGDAAVGTALVSHPGVRKVSFTGSVAVGKSIMAAAAGTVKRVSLELGGNDPAIVLPGADLATTLPLLARGAFTRAGQVCFAVKRIYVARALHDDLVDGLMDIVHDYRVGHGLDEGTTFGPLISAAAKSRVEGIIDRAAHDGGKVLQAGKPTADWDQGHYLLPHIVTGLDQSAELTATEQFGPVVPVIPFDDVDEAVTFANDSEFGLCSSVWSTDLDDAMAVARRVEAGVTFINNHTIPALTFDIPFGGVKASGMGRERTELGLREYVEEHAIRIARAAE